MSHGSIRWIKQYWEELSQFITISHNSGPPFSVVIVRNALLSWWFWTCILKIYIHSPLMMASKVQQVAISKGIKRKKHIWLILTKKLEALNMSLRVHTITGLLHYTVVYQFAYSLQITLQVVSVISSLYVWNQLNEWEPGKIV